MFGSTAFLPLPERYWFDRETPKSKSWEDTDLWEFVLWRLVSGGA